MQTLNNCGCCEGLSVETPVEVYNRPGLKAITYRAGDYAAFRHSLLARLSTAGLPALRSLTTRNNDDFTIALLDAWSCVADVLTFYQERIANESYLGTATEQRSIVELARLIGYQLRPGVAADAFIAFTLEDTPGAAGQVLVSGTSRSRLDLPPVNITPGTKVQSIPGPEEKPQTFETLQTIEARAEWNAVRPRLTQPQLTIPDKTIIVVEGTSNDLKTGDLLLVTTSKGKVMKVIVQLGIDPDTKTTRVYLDAGAGFAPFATPWVNADGNIDANGDVAVFQEKTITDDTLVKLLNKVWKEEDLSVLIQTKKWSVTDLQQSMALKMATLSDTSGVVHVFRKRTSVFGYNALRQVEYKPNGVPKLPSEWTEWDLSLVDKKKDIYLDSVYEQVLPGSYIGVQKPDVSLDKTEVYEALAVNIRSRSDYGLSMKTTAVTITTGLCEPCTSLSSIRNITIHAQSEPVALAESPIDSVVKGKLVMLGKWYPGFKKGRMIILSGDRDDLKGAAYSELRVLTNAFIVHGFTVLELDEVLTYPYIAKTVYINANVALASHGETVKEVLGSGNAAASFQKFQLKQFPLTYISAKTPSGTQSTLEIRVNDILWHEVPSLYHHLPGEHIYCTRLDDEGKTTVIFGDGKTGARLPTGQENIKATYRKGIGEEGLLKANQLSQLLTRPLGVKGATNPLPSSGAENREAMADARSNATLTIFTLDRIVSLKDYEDYARAFAGISKSLATWGWCGRRRCVYITVAGIHGAVLTGKDPVYLNLIAAIKSAGIPDVPFQLVSYQPRFFRLSANILVAPDYIFENVIAAVTQQLRQTFSFERRTFGQSVVSSEVIAVIQHVEGVLAVDLDTLYISDDEPAPNDRLDAAVPGQGFEKPLPAELIMIDPGPIDLKKMP